MSSTITPTVTSSVPTYAESHPALSWRSVIAGLLVSFLAFGILLSLGIALGGVSLSDGASLKNSGIAGALWLLFSILLSLFAGSYFSSRVSNYTSPWAGMAHGAVLSALFIGIVLWQFVGLATWLTKSAGSLVGGAAQAGAPVVQQASNQLDYGFNDIVEDNMAGVQFKQDPKTVMTGVASRLVRGNDESAKAYLARNTNLSKAEIDQRITQVQAQLKDAGDKAQKAAAGALKATGWTLFLTTLLGFLVSAAAGVMGSAANRLEPAIRAELPGMHPRHLAHT